MTGATGALGRALLPELTALGAPIRVLEHQMSSLLPRERLLCERVHGDLAKPGTLRGAVDGCDVVVHAAARTGFARFARDTQRRINVEGTEALIREAESAGARVFVLIGYAGTVQERDDTETPVDEETSPEGRYESEYVRMKYEAETLTLEANRAGVFRSMVVSPGVVLHPGASTILGGLVQAFVAGELPYRLLPEVWLATSDGSDVGRGTASAIERGHGGRRYFATGDCFRLGDLYTLLGEHSGVAPPRRRLPDLLVEELGLLTPVLPPHSFLRQLVLPRELVLHLKRLAPVRNDRTRSDLQFEPTPFKTTLASVIGAGPLDRRAGESA